MNINGIQTWSRAIPAINLIFGFTIFLSAFLLFQIQPLISKYILSWFGGGPSVWTSAMMFFQVLLLGGYAYAHWLNRLPLSRQRIIHLSIGALALVWIAFTAMRWASPVTPGPEWKPDNAGLPIFQVLLVLLVGVGLPFFLLSSTSSLVQSWFSQVQRQESPYAFYSLSNAASLLALLSYPVLLEPRFSIQQQGQFWSSGFVLYLLSLAVCLYCTRSVKTSGTEHDLPYSAAHQESQVIARAGELAPSRRRVALWLTLSACASMMLLASTNQLCQDVASMPFLWVLPLSLYLLSFVIAFNNNQLRLRGLYITLTLVALGLGLLNLSFGSRMNLWLQIGSNSFMLLVISLLCHSELYRHRPSPRHLTGFYLAMSVGGALGGIFVNLLAPLVFPDFWEYNLGLLFCALVVIVLAYQSQGTQLYRLRMPVAVVGLVLAVLIVALPVAWLNNSLVITRNFYGVIKIRKMDGEIPQYMMAHGAINHGSQAIDEPYRSQPTTYYTQSSGIGITLLNHPRRVAGQPMRIGVIGLGVGVLASYGQPGDVIRFYEIDPHVIQYAQDTRYFHFLSDSKAQIDMVLGDGRMSLERELEEGGSQQYDLLVLDAFSGDSIPAHLVSREAIELYQKHLAPGGVLAFNISNRHINLEPVLALAGQHFNLPGVLLQQQKPTELLGATSTWVVFSPEPRLFDVPDIAALKRDLKTIPGIHMWTDDYGNLFQVLR